MASIQVESNSYEVYIRFADRPSNDIYDDVLYYAIFRMPFKKQCTFHKLKLNLPLYIATQATNEVNDHNGLMVELTINLVSSGPDGANFRSAIYQRRLYVLNVHTNMAPDIINQQQAVPVELVLADPILYIMSSKLSYNKVINQATGIKILEDYEKHIEKIYGKCFDFYHVISNPNKYIYEQFLTTPQSTSYELDKKEFTFNYHSDLDIPAYLQQQLKISQDLSFYFFDDFCLNSKKDIRACFISVTNKDILKKVDLTGQTDVTSLSKLIKYEPFNDIEKIIHKSNPTLTFQTNVGEFVTSKTDYGATYKVDTTKSKAYTVNGRKESSFSNESNFSAVTVKRNLDFININTPDNTKQAISRIENAISTYNDKIDTLCDFESTNVTPDVIQFGNIYALLQDYSTYYIYSPIAIINVFRRNDPKNITLKHHINFKMIKYKYDEKKK